MQKKVSITGFAARDAVIRGAEMLAGPVGATLGPFGLNALIEKGETVTNDGFKISQELCGTFQNEFERRGAVTLHKACAKTNTEVGDATTTSEILALAITKEAMRYLPKDETTFVAKKRQTEIIAEIKDSKDKVLKKLEAMAKPIKTKEELVASALVSVEDKNLAKMIGETQFALGKDGVIIVEESNDSTCSISIAAGIRTDNGFATPATFDNAEMQQIEIEDCAVILTNYVIESLATVKILADALAVQGQRKIAIIAKAFSGLAIKEINKNAEGGLFFYPINAPFTAQGEIMKDLEAVTGGTYIDTETNSFSDANLAYVGYAKKIVAARWTTTVIGDKTKDSKERVATRCEKILKELKGSVSDFERQLLEKRLAMLTNGIGVLKIGADTETERSRLKDKADDAVNAVRYAYKGGTVEGAGLAFKAIADEMKDTDILKRPLSLINQMIMNSAPKTWKVEKWVRDPFLVLKAALENASSVAATLFTTNTVIATKNPQQCYCGKAAVQSDQEYGE